MRLCVGVVLIWDVKSSPRRKHQRPEENQFFEDEPYSEGASVQAGGHQVQLIGVKYFEAIRSQLKRIVVGTVQRANPFLGAVLTGDVFADPFLWATLDSLKTFRVFGLGRSPGYV